MNKDNNESYKHFYAKKVLISWLNNSNGKFFSLRWSNNYRVYDEYPFILNENILTCGKNDIPWDTIPVKFCDCLLIYKNTLLKNNILCKHNLIRDDFIPTREELIQHNFKTGIIADIVLIDNNKIKYIFEVYNTNPLNPMKRNILQKYSTDNNVIVFEVNSDYILRQVNTPDKWRGVKLTETSNPIRRRKKYKKYYNSNKNE